MGKKQLWRLIFTACFLSWSSTAMSQGAGENWWPQLGVCPNATATQQREAYNLPGLSVFIGTPYGIALKMEQHPGVSGVQVLSSGSVIVESGAHTTGTTVFFSKPIGLSANYDIKFSMWPQGPLEPFVYRYRLFKCAGGLGYRVEAWSTKNGALWKVFWVGIAAGRPIEVQNIMEFGNYYIIK